MTASRLGFNITTVRFQSSGGETYRVGTTGLTVRPALRLPCTPHHNANVAVLNTQKNRSRGCALIRFRGSNPGSRFCGCTRNIAPDISSCQMVSPSCYLENPGQKLKAPNTRSALWQNRLTRFYTLDLLLLFFVIPAVFCYPLH